MIEVFSNGSWLQIIWIILMICDDEQTLVSLCKKIGIVHSYLFDHDNVSERKIALNFKQILTFDGR